MIPVYGFLEGDTIGILVLVDQDERIEDLARKLQTAARMRVAPHGRVTVLHNGRQISLGSTVNQAGIQALDRFDVREAT